MFVKKPYIESIYNFNTSHYYSHIILKYWTKHIERRINNIYFLYFKCGETADKKMKALHKIFGDNRGTVLAGGLAAALTLASLSPATAQDVASADQGQQAAVPQTVSAPANQSTAPDDIEIATKREAWKASKENGGTLVIWYDARHHNDAVEMVGALKLLGKKNVVALAGRDDGNFVLIGNGRTIPYQFSLREARDGTLGGEAMIFAEQRNIAALDIETSDGPDRNLG